MEVHLKDLIQDGVYLLLEDNYRNWFFQEFLSKFKTKKLAAEFLNLSSGCVVLLYHRGTNSCPLSTINKIANFIKEDIKNVEVNVKSIRTKTGRGIKNPKFPIKLDKNLSRILGNLIGDGCVSIDSKNYLRLFYTNFEDILIDKFKATVHECFGEVQLGDSRERGWHVIYLPKILGIIITKFISKTKSSTAEVPEIILKSSKEMKIEFLKGLFDDDGFVGLYEKKSNRVIGLASSSLKLINQIKEVLHIDFDIESHVVPHDEGMFNLCIRDRENIIRFKENIGFTDGFYRQVLLEKVIKSYKRIITKQGKRGKLIIELLKKEGDLRTDETAKKLNLRERNTYEHLKRLRSLGLVQSTPIKPIRNEKGQIKDNFSHLWSLRE